ncbi:MAG TPA: PQQ-binding-like beta-propeller repeat protein [Planctomycetota bacterium]|nr:PQQ-binding-like beta-propeller repeat protein [Planctomycetota bacterium]
MTLSRVMLATCLIAAACGWPTENAIGWRGDGTGRFPDADPPINWGRVSAEVKGLRFQAAKPANDQPAGTAMSDGVVREWLLLGPVPIPPDVPKAIEQDTLPNETQLSPVDGEKIESGLAWKKIEADGATLDFNSLFSVKPKPADTATTTPAASPQEFFAYAHTYIFSETGGDFLLNLTHRHAARVILNGKQLSADSGTGGRHASAKLQKGWNRLLLKIASDNGQWFAVPFFCAHGAKQYEASNIAWFAPLPGARVYQGTPAGPGGPIVVGDKLFVLCEPHDLFCLNKSSGKVLWARSNSYFDALTDAEKNADPAFKEIEPLAAKWNALNDEYVAGKVTTKSEEREKLEKNLYDALRKIDKKRFTRPDGQDIGYAGLTPASDGKYVYAWFAHGVTACYDLDGKRQWIRIDNHEKVEHGFSSSPLLIGGKLVVFMRELMAFDAKTGTEAWRIPIVGPTGMNPGGWFHGSLSRARIGDVETIVPANGSIIRASDGKLLFSDKRLAMNQEVATPVIQSGKAYIMTTASEKLNILRLPDAAGETLAPEFVTELRIPTTQFPTFYLGWHLASPLVHAGLVYLMNNSGVLTVVDEKANSIVYQRVLDLDPYQDHNEAAARGLGISPAYAGGRIYFFGNSGAALVLEPGRAYKQLAKNRIEGLAVPGTWGERPDRAVAFPFFDGGRIYYRTEMGIYAIGEK